MDQQVWRKTASCRNLTLEESDNLFFLGRGKKSTRAKQFCKTCPVRRECLTFAVIHHEYGIWGGYTDLEREDMYYHIIQFFENNPSNVILESRNVTDWLPANLFLNQQVVLLNQNDLQELPEEHFQPRAVLQVSALTVLVVQQLDPQLLEDALRLAEELLAVP